MAISPPSDIVSEVAGAADPARYQAAAQKLLGGTAPAGGASFEEAVRATSVRPAGGADVYTMRNSLRNDAESANAAKSRQAHQDFEAFILQTFVESMLPKEAENTYGKGSAGSIWKSMMAEQIGNQISRAGGIGIAKYVLGERKVGSPIGVPSMPPTPSFTIQPPTKA